MTKDKDNERLKNLLKALLTKRMLIVLLLGFSSGLPIMLLYSSLKIWMRREGVDLSTIGYFSWVTLPYSFNYLWAFALDRFIPSSLGRRRSWLLITQVGLVASMLLLFLGDPKISIPYMVVAGFLLCFFSATQDIAVDAYRREILPDNELGIGSSIGVYGYRVGMLVASGVGLWTVDPETFGFSFNQMFLMMAAFMSIGLITTFFATEPKIAKKGPETLKAAVLEPFMDFLKRPHSILLLFFILFYKMGDSMGGSMLGAYYVDMGFSNKVIAEVTKGIGFISSMAGLFVGGALIFRLGIFPSLWIFGLLQAVSTGFMSILSAYPNSIPHLTSVVAFEDFTSGMGTSALVAFMASLTNKKFTATQYALFSSLASFGRTFLSGFSGELIARMQYFGFYFLCAGLALPGLIILYKLKKAGFKLEQQT